ncbi:MAG: peptidoglycan-associated lipoprotein Pal [Gemmatimonadaceae bacterium]
MPPSRTPTAAEAGDRSARDDSLTRAADARAHEARLRAEKEEAARREHALGEARAPIYFGFDLSMLTEEARAKLDAKVEFLAAEPTMRIRIDGHADERGSDEYNLALGQRRATAAMRYLIDRGISAERIETVSFGEERPVCSASTEACWTQNRRDEFVVASRGPSNDQP